MADLLPNINDAAASPKSVTSDGESATQQSIPDLIAADKYQKAASVTRGLGIRVVGQRPPSNADIDSCR